jgi:chromosome segregation ATPase
LQEPLKPVKSPLKTTTQENLGFFQQEDEMPSPLQPVKTPVKGLFNEDEEEEEIHPEELKEELRQAEEKVYTPPQPTQKPKVEEDVPYPEDFVLELEKLSLAKACVESNVESLNKKIEILDHDVNMLKSDNSWLRTKLTAAEKAIADTKAEALGAQRDLLKEKELNRQKKMQMEVKVLEGRLAQALKDNLLLREELEKEKYESNSVQELNRSKSRINELDRELRSVKKTQDEFKQEKSTLERDAGLWKSRLEERQRKEELAKKLMLKECKNLERICEQQGAKVKGILHKRKKSKSNFFPSPIEFSALYLQKLSPQEGGRKVGTARFQIVRQNPAQSSCSVSCRQTRL